MHSFIVFGSIALIIFFILIFIFIRYEKKNLIKINEENFSYFEPGSIIKCYESDSKIKNSYDLVFSGKIIERKDEIVVLNDGMNTFEKDLSIILSYYPKIDLYDETGKTLIKSFDSIFYK